MIVILNLERIDSDGKLIPANNPNYAVPSYIKYAQLRYNTFSNSYVVQGTFLATGESSTIEFDLSSVSSSYTLFKLYTSTDGVTYTEDKTYGGTTGRTIFTSIAGTVMTTGDQTIAGVKTFSSLPVSNATVSSNSQLTNKTYVDRAYGQSIKLVLNQTVTGAITYRILYNKTSYSISSSVRNSAGDYSITFNGAIFNNPDYVSFEYQPILIDDSATIYGYVVIPPTGLTTTRMNIQTSSSGQFAADSILTQFVLTINIYS